MYLRGYLFFEIIDFDMIVKKSVIRKEVKDNQ